MSDLLKFLPLLFFIFVGVSIARNVLRVARRLNSQEPPRPGELDPDLAERTRRIQEEIRRKIAERRGLLPPAPAPLPEPMGEPPIVMVEDDPAESAPVTAPAATHAAILERQQQLADQMRALERARETAQRRAGEFAAAVQAEAATEMGQLAGSNRELLADLREPAGLRRAIVLREILGPPVGLR